MTITIQYLRDAVAHAPQAGPIAPGLLGWSMQTDTGAVYLCEICASRILARGCTFGTTARALWQSSVRAGDIPVGPCACACGRKGLGDK